MFTIETTWTAVRLGVHRLNRRTGRLVGDRGEGVISAAIAVLIVAFIGAAMWVAFNRIWTGAEANIETQVTRIGR
ncbi:MAG: hypothetical protein D6683_14520 [Actinomyces sp.]|nr:MAG: hypothetical protein D6683_14520 [Actinomyces sp.]